LTADGDLEKYDDPFAAGGEDGESMLPEGLPRLDEESEVEVDVSDELAERHQALAERFRERPHKSGMLRKAGWLLRFVGTLLFAHVLFGQRNADNIRDAAKRGTPVYVMHSRSFLDYLYFNYAFLKHDLPLAQYANGVNTMWVRGPLAWLKGLFRRGPSEKPEEQVQALVKNDEAVFLFLEKPRKGVEHNLEFSQKYLTRLVQAQKQIDEPIYVLPMLLIWEKRPDPKRAGLLEDIFGTAQRPSFFRKFVGFFQTFWQSFLRLGQPIVQISTSLNLHEFLREYPNAGSADASELLRERVVDYLEQERHVILGPTGEPTDKLYKELINRPALTEAVQQIAEQEDVSEDDIRERVREQLDEIVARPSLLTLKVFSSLLSFVWYRIYDGFEVDVEGLEEVREAARKSSIVLVPSHKSHIDYLVLSYIFYTYGMITPLIAAGVNLSFWPLGPLFRGAGAFFIRRSFRGEELYPVVFREYLIHQMEEGYPIEFFIEGTRSRTGKLIKPKYGMLDMIIRAYTSGRIDSVKIVPISVGYEKIIEEGSYRREVLGAEKEKETLGGLLKTPKFLTSKYGRLYVEFSDAIDLGSYLDRYGVDRLRPKEEELDSLTVRLAHRIIYDINHVSTVTPSSLAATVLLNNPMRGSDRRRFLHEVGFLLYFLTHRFDSTRLSRTIREGLEENRAALDRLEERQPTPALKSRPDGKPGLDEESAPLAADGASDQAASPSTDEVDHVRIETVMGEAVSTVLDEAIGLFEDNDQVVLEETEEDIFYSVPEESRLELAYYRNNIVHYFVPEALLATAIRRFGSQQVALEPLMEETRFLSRLFKFEWIYEESAEFENVFLRTLAYFEHAGWVSADEISDETLQVEVHEPFPAELDFFRRLVPSFLEAYAIVGDLLGEMEGVWEREDLVKKALKRARNDYLRGRILYYETLSKPTFKNAVRLFEDWGVIERQEEVTKGSAYRYRLDEDWRGERLEELQNHLRSFVHQER
jgi:glycerol-3-phosphate O-acyltransferase